MSSSAPVPESRAIRVAVADDALQVDLVDGRRISVPLDWFPRLLQATPEQRGHWRLIGDGEGIRWPDLDEDISVAGLLRGRAAPGATRRAI
ncbi:MAG: DUF2442 domain-containing protein [Planctomycetota bacterium]|nr:MAG: DUF2442 domain-containing protein [Planctomycetota bacterium]